MPELKGNPFRPAVTPVLEELRTLRTLIDAEIAAAEKMLAHNAIPPEADWHAFGQAFNERELSLARLSVRSLDLVALLEVSEWITRPRKPRGDA